MRASALKKLLVDRDPRFWQLLEQLTAETSDFGELFHFCTLRKRAWLHQIPRPDGALKEIRVAIVGGFSLYPFHELLNHFCEGGGFRCNLWLGAYDNYVSEIMDETSALHEFKPEFVIILPADQRCRYAGKLTDPETSQQAALDECVQGLFDLANRLHTALGAEVIVTNMILPARHDLGAYRLRSLGSDWSFRKGVNLALGIKAPSHLHICDAEFLAYRMGGLLARDERAWFESKQPCSLSLLVEIARETAGIIVRLNVPPKKVLVIDLDNTLWGGVVADDGLDGIEIGDTSPRGEAFKAFQTYIRSLKDRGVLLAVCSKNDHAKAVEVFEKHPEMVLRMHDFVAFKANWDLKADNIHQIAAELNLGPDSLVFVDDNPAEVEIVRQFAPDVETILLGPDPSSYVTQLQDCRFFEPKSLSAEDAMRTGQYKMESERQALRVSATGLQSYLMSLEMEATVSEFSPLDVPRLAQLINKSNQFNLTTRRRTEAEVAALIGNERFIGFSVRLRDRFGDHGLISIVIAEVVEWILVIDTWLMSCRVLKRQVEDLVLNELVRIARDRRCTRLQGDYIPTAKNEMVRDFYPRMGFTPLEGMDGTYIIELETFQPYRTPIKLQPKSHESLRNNN